MSRCQTADEILYWYGSGDVVHKSNKLVSISEADVFVCINDRTILSDDWRDRLDAALVEYLHIDVFSFTGTSCSQFAVRRRFLARYNGNMFYPGYTHYHPDQEIGEIARRESKYKELAGMIEEIYEKQDGVVTDPSYDKELYHLRERYNFPV